MAKSRLSPFGENDLQQPREINTFFGTAVLSNACQSRKVRKSVRPVEETYEEYSNWPKELVHARPSDRKAEASSRESLFSSQSPFQSREAFAVHSRREQHHTVPCISARRLARSICLPAMQGNMPFVTAGPTDRCRMRSNWFQQNEKNPLPLAQSPCCSTSCTTAGMLKPRPWCWAGCAQHFSRRTSPCILRKLFFLRLLCVFLVWR